MERLALALPMGSVKLGSLKQETSRNLAILDFHKSCRTDAMNAAIIAVMVIAAITSIVCVVKLAYYRPETHEETPDQVQVPERPGDDWSEQDVDDYINYLGNCEDWWGE